ncbi:MAG: septum formation protein Maf [Clostridia bacterium]|nr:septum formation protein Maf [Clostridia bacterium]
MRFILASASPRRAELIKEFVKESEIIPAQGEEMAVAGTPRKLVEALSKQKADEVYSNLNGADIIVLGADTVVAYGKKVLGKPKTEAEAFEMLKMLSGRSHNVYTGVCFVYTSKGGKKYVNRSAKTRVTFNKLSDEWITEYVKSGSPMDKAGAYGIQDGGLVKRIRGSFTNVVGLPVELCKKLYAKIIKEQGKEQGYDKNCD